MAKAEPESGPKPRHRPSPATKPTPKPTLKPNPALTLTPNPALSLALALTANPALTLALTLTNDATNDYKCRLGCTAHYTAANSTLACSPPRLIPTPHTLCPQRTPKLSSSSSRAVLLPSLWVNSRVEVGVEGIGIKFDRGNSWVEVGVKLDRGETNLIRLAG